MNFQTMTLVTSFLCTIIASLIGIPILKKIKIGQIERSDGPKSHLSKQGTPTMGGIIFIITIIIVSIFASKVLIEKGETEILKKMIPMIILTLGYGVVGLVDDLKKLVFKNTDGLKPAYKMLGLLMVSVLFTLYLVKFSGMGTGVFIPFLKIYIDLPVYVFIPFAILVILATTNAVNLTDGVDGLASSVCAIIITCLTVIGMIKNVPEVSIFGSIVVGGILGFLTFNLHPAKVMMGDTGSLFLGGVIACLALYLKMPLLLIVIAIIPILETLSVIIQVSYFKKTGNRVFRMTPLHHHYELSGWNENKVVRVFSIITLLASIIGLMII